MDLSANQFAATNDGVSSVRSSRGGIKPGRSREYFSFHGSGSEYFRIWIVNLLLTILTVGLYSPWAKVRKNRYIYGNLQLAGSHFDYLARPLMILSGRLIALALLLAVVVSQWAQASLYLVFFLLVALVTPWLVVRARMFNMRYTAYRNIRFAFHPAYAQAYKAIFLYGLLSLITLGLLVPYAHFKRNQMVVDNTRYGNLKFSLDDVGGKFFATYFFGFCVGAALIAPATAMLAQTGSYVASVQDNAPDSLRSIAFVPVLLGFLFYFVIAKYVAALTLRITTNHTRIGLPGQQSHHLGCDWSLPGMLSIYVTNLVAIVLSAGLLTPWAQMRILKYQLDHTWIDVAGGIETVVAGQTQSVSSLGEEIGDVFDVDIGL